MDPPRPVEIIKHKKGEGLLIYWEYRRIVLAHGAKRAQNGEPLAKLWLLSSGSGYVHTLSSGVTPFKISVAIFRSLITSHF